MGKLEKVVVLSVLGLIAVILVISLSLDDPLKKEKAVWAGNPPGKASASETAAAVSSKDANAKAAPSAQLAAGDKANANEARPAADMAAKPADSAQAGGAQIAIANGAHPTDANADKSAAAAPSALLSANVAPGQPDVVAPAIPSGSILKTIDGLQDSYSPDMKFYTWQAGDSFRSVSTKYYGDAAKFTLLRRTNEGRDNVQAGEKILVPVFDLDGGHGAAAPTAKLDDAAKPDASAKSSAPKVADASGGPRVHVVKDGESLWKIAKLELGDGGRWNEIYEANRDVLSKPEAVHAGLKLRIPVK